MTPRIRQAIYYFGTIATSGVGLALLFNGINAGAADHATQIISALVALLGAGAPALAGKTLNDQRKEGVLDAVSPADQVISGVQAVREAAVEAQAQIDRVRAAVSDVVDDVPILGPLALQALERLK